MKLRGHLGEFPLADVVQFISMGRKTGRLDLCGAETSSLGSIFFEGGQVIHASREETDGEEALFALLSLGDGTFEFHDTITLPSRSLNIPTHQLLLRAAQRADEAGLEGDLDPGGGLGDLDLGGLEPDIASLKEKMKNAILHRLGKKGKKVLPAVDSAEDHLEGLMETSDRIQRYVSLFFDPQTGEELGRDLRKVIGL